MKQNDIISNCSPTQLRSMWSGENFDMRKPNVLVWLAFETAFRVEILSRFSMHRKVICRASADNRIEIREKHISFFRWILRSFFSMLSFASDRVVRVSTRPSGEFVRAVAVERLRRSRRCKNEKAATERIDDCVLIIVFILILLNWHIRWQLEW